MATTDRPLPKTLQCYVDHLARAGRPLDFTEIVSVTPGVNRFRDLRSRGLIENIVPGYSGNEPYTGPRTSQYVLTAAGWRQTTVFQTRGDQTRSDHEPYEEGQQGCGL